MIKKHTTGCVQKKDMCKKLKSAENCFGMYTLLIETMNTPESQVSEKWNMTWFTKIY